MRLRLPACFLTLIVVLISGLVPFSAGDDGIILAQQPQQSTTNDFINTTSQHFQQPFQSSHHADSQTANHAQGCQPGFFSPPHSPTDCLWSVFADNITPLHLERFGVDISSLQPLYKPIRTEIATDPPRFEVDPMTGSIVDYEQQSMISYVTLSSAVHLYLPYPKGTPSVIDIPSRVSISILITTYHSPSLEYDDSYQVYSLDLSLSTSLLTFSEIDPQTMSCGLGPAPCIQISLLLSDLVPIFRSRYPHFHLFTTHESPNLHSLLRFRITIREDLLLSPLVVQSPSLGLIHHCAVAKSIAPHICGGANQECYHASSTRTPFLQTYDSYWNAFIHSPPTCSCTPPFLGPSCTTVDPPGRFTLRCSPHSGAQVASGTVDDSSVAVSSYDCASPPETLVFHDALFTPCVQPASREPPTWSPSLVFPQRYRLVRCRDSQYHPTDPRGYVDSRYCEQSGAILTHFECSTPWLYSAVYPHSETTTLPLQDTPPSDHAPPFSLELSRKDPHPFKPRLFCGILDEQGKTISFSHMPRLLLTDDYNYFSSCDCISCQDVKTIQSNPDAQLPKPVCGVPISRDGKPFTVDGYLDPSRPVPFVDLDLQAKELRALLLTGNLPPLTSPIYDGYAEGDGHYDYLLQMLNFFRYCLDLEPFPYCGEVPAMASSARGSVEYMQIINIGLEKASTVSPPHHLMVPYEVIVQWKMVSELPSASGPQPSFYRAELHKQYTSARWTNYAQKLSQFMDLPWAPSSQNSTNQNPLSSNGYYAPEDTFLTSLLAHSVPRALPTRGDIVYRSDTFTPLSVIVDDAMNMESIGYLANDDQQSADSRQLHPLGLDDDLGDYYHLTTSFAGSYPEDIRTTRFIIPFLESLDTLVVRIYPEPHVDIPRTIFAELQLRPTNAFFHPPSPTGGVDTPILPSVCDQARLDCGIGKCNPYLFTWPFLPSVFIHKNAVIAARRQLCTCEFDYHSEWCDLVAPAPDIDAHGVHQICSTQQLVCNNNAIHVYDSSNQSESRDFTWCGCACRGHWKSLPSVERTHVAVPYPPIRHQGDVASSTHQSTVIHKCTECGLQCPGLLTPNNDCTQCICNSRPCLSRLTLHTILNLNPVGFYQKDLHQKQWFFYQQLGQELLHYFSLSTHLEYVAVTPLTFLQPYVLKVTLFLHEGIHKSDIESHLVIKRHMAYRPSPPPSDGDELISIYEYLLLRWSVLVANASHFLYFRVFYDLLVNESMPQFSGDTPTTFPLNTTVTRAFSFGDDMGALCRHQKYPTVFEQCPFPSRADHHLWSECHEHQQPGEGSRHLDVACFDFLGNNLSDTPVYGPQSALTLQPSGDAICAVHNFPSYPRVVQLDCPRRCSAGLDWRPSTQRCDVIPELSLFRLLLDSHIQDIPQIHLTTHTITFPYGHVFHLRWVYSGNRQNTVFISLLYRSGINRTKVPPVIVATGIPASQQEYSLSLTAEHFELLTLNLEQYTEDASNPALFHDFTFSLTIAQNVEFVFYLGHPSRHDGFIQYSLEFPQCSCPEDIEAAHQHCDRTVLPYACQCNHDEGYFPSRSLPSEGESLTCLGRCDALLDCQNGGQCTSSSRTRCHCLDPFYGDQCEGSIHCSTHCGNGYQPTNVSTGRCESKCSCYGNWRYDASGRCTVCALNTSHYTLNPGVVPEDHEFQQCNPKGTHDETYTGDQCKTCLCKEGYTGPTCATAVIYTAHHFRESYGLLQDGGRAPMELGIPLNSFGVLSSLFSGQTSSLFAIGESSQHASFMQEPKHDLAIVSPLLPYNQGRVNLLEAIPPFHILSLRTELATVLSLPLDTISILQVNRTVSITNVMDDSDDGVRVQHVSITTSFITQIADPFAVVLYVAPPIEVTSAVISGPHEHPTQYDFSSFYSLWNDVIEDYDFTLLSSSSLTSSYGAPLPPTPNDIYHPSCDQSIEQSCTTGLSPLLPGVGGRPKSGTGDHSDRADPPLVNPTSAPHLSHGAIAGIVIGVLVGVIFITIIILYYLCSAFQRHGYCLPCRGFTVYIRLCCIRFRQALSRRKAGRDPNMIEMALGPSSGWDHDTLVTLAEVFGPHSDQGDHAIYAQSLYELRNLSGLNSDEPMSFHDELSFQGGGVLRNRTDTTNSLSLISKSVDHLTPFNNTLQYSLSEQRTKQELCDEISIQRLSLLEELEPHIIDSVEYMDHTELVTAGFCQSNPHCFSAEVDDTTQLYESAHPLADAHGLEALEGHFSPEMRSFYDDTEFLIHSNVDSDDGSDSSDDQLDYVVPGWVQLYDDTFDAYYYEEIATGKRTWVLADLNPGSNSFFDDDNDLGLQHNDDMILASP